LSILEHVFFHVHGIYVMKFLNCVCVFYVKTETTIQYDHNKLKLKQFNKKFETTIRYDHNKLKLKQFNKNLKQQFDMIITNWNLSNSIKNLKQQFNMIITNWNLSNSIKIWNNNSIWSYQIETSQHGDEKKWNNKKKGYKLDQTPRIIMHMTMFFCVQPCKTLLIDTL